MLRKHALNRALALAFLALCLQFAASTMTVHAASSAVLVYAYGFSKGVEIAHNGNLIALNKTSSFTQDDSVVYAWLEAAFYSANLTWKYYDPLGQLVKNQTRILQCVQSPCYAYSYMRIAFSAIATQFGRWRLDVFNGNVKLYTDYFYLNPVLTQTNNWSFDIESSAPSLVYGNLSVTIHPSNGTWSYYQMYMPYASNVTAFQTDSGTELNVTKNNSLVLVNLGKPRSAGYMFTIGFTVQGGVSSLNGWAGGAFALAWQDQPWQRFNDPHPIFETFNITLPPTAQLAYIVGVNSLDLSYNLATGARQSIGFDTTVVNEPFGWTIIYRDFSYSRAHPQPVSGNQRSFSFGSGPVLPVLPLTLNALNAWAAVTSVLLLTASELASPIYSKSGSHLLINRKRLRLVALILVVIFVAGTAYNLAIQSQAIPR